MSTIIMSKFWELKIPKQKGITPGVVKSVLISLADNANDHGYCWPSIPKIMERTCFERNAVINAIEWLERNGFLKADRSNGRHTKYQLLFSDELINQFVQQTSLPDKPVGSRTKPVGQTNSNRKNHQEPSGTVNKEKSDDFVIPEWIDPDLWSDFVDMRKQIKKPMSVAAAKLLITKLEGFRVKGFDVAELIGNSIIGGWPSVYEPKTSNKPSGTSAFDPVAYINKNRISKQGDNHESIDGDYKRVG